MDTFKYTDQGSSVEVEFTKESGVVLDTRRDKEALVRGTIRDGRGDIETETIENHEVWVKTDSGTEVCFDLTNAAIPVRKGQRITILSAFSDAKSDSCRLFLINHSAEKVWTFSDYENTCSFFGLMHRGKIIYVLALIFVFGVGFYLESSIIMAICAAVAAYYYVKEVRPKNRTTIERMKTHLSGILEENCDFVVKY